MNRTGRWTAHCPLFWKLPSRASRFLLLCGRPKHPARRRLLHAELLFVGLSPDGKRHDIVARRNAGLSGAKAAESAAGKAQRLEEAQPKPACRWPARDVEQR